METLGHSKLWMKLLIITTFNDMANTMKNSFSSVFTTEQLNNVPQSCRYESNILDTLNFITEEVLKKLQHSNIIYKSTGPDMLHPRILRGQTCKTPNTHT